MLQKFKSYQLAVQFYRQAKGIKFPVHFKNQFLRASSSIALNLGEGCAKPSKADRRRFYYIALGSIRECEAIVELNGDKSEKLRESLDKLARHVYRLCKSLD